MNAVYILGALSLVLLALALGRIIKGGRASHPQTRTWVIVGVVFGLVSLWLTAGR
jgi:hypothetical protein